MLVEKYLILFSSLLVLMSSCKKEQPKASSLGDYEITFDNTFNTIRAQSLKSDEIDWNRIQKIVKDSIKTFHSEYELLDALKYTLGFLNDKHSYVWNHNDNYSKKDSSIIPEIQSKIVDKNIAYIKIPGFSGNSSLATLFAIRIRSAIIDIDSSNQLNGWIFDLMGNTGGECFSQILGVSPFLQDSIVGYFKANNGQFKTMISSKNIFKFNNKIEGQIDLENSLVNRGIKIAILIDGETASTGELVAITLKNHNSSTKIFGSSSLGLTTIQTVIQFNPGNAAIGYFTHYMCDANKKFIGKYVVPDFESAPEESLEKAIFWLKA